MAGSGLLEVPQQIALALTLASNATGADFDYLMKTAARESSFRPAAVARTSSARGLFQFIEETWLRTIKEDGAKHGLGDLAKKIFRTRSGRYYVPDAVARRSILKLRFDPKISSLMAGVYTQRNKELVQSRIGRVPTGGELYLAHFLGPSDAVRMIELTASNPHFRADQMFPRAAKANRSIFYDRSRPRSVREVYRQLVRKYNQAGGRRGASWSTHMVRIDPKKLKTYTRRLLTKRVAPKGNVPLPALKQVPAPVDTGFMSVQTASARMDTIGEMLRGSMGFFSMSSEHATSTRLSMTE